MENFPGAKKALLFFKCPSLCAQRHNFSSSTLVSEKHWSGESPRNKKHFPTLLCAGWVAWTRSSSLKCAIKFSDPLSPIEFKFTSRPATDGSIYFVVCSRVKVLRLQRVCCTHQEHELGFSVCAPLIIPHWYFLAHSASESVIFIWNRLSYKRGGTQCENC